MKLLVYPPQKSKYGKPVVFSTYLSYAVNNKNSLWKQTLMEQLRKS